MTLRRLGLGLAVAAILAGALWFGRTSEPRLTAEPERAPSATTKTSIDTAPRAPKPTPVESVPPARDRRNLAEPRAEPAPAPLEIDGTVVVLDERGAEHRAENGALALVIDGGGRRDLLVRGGRWSTKAVPGSLRFASARLGNRPAVLAPGQTAELPISADGRVELRLRWPAGPLLHVLARDTRLELEPITLCELPPRLRGSPGDAAHPGELAKAASREVGPSPVRIEALEHEWTDERVLFAKAPGYAWGRIELREGEDRDQTLLLDPAGTLELELVNAPNYSGMEVRLLDADAPLTEMLDVERGSATRSFVFEDLPAGSYVVEARESGLLIGSAETEVTAGERVKALLQVMKSESKLVPFEGTLIVPEEWRPYDSSLQFWLEGRFESGSGGLSDGSFEIPLSEMTPEKDSPERFHWSAPHARAARYRIEFGNFTTDLDTGPNGTRDARVEVPRLATVFVHCVDGETGREVTSETVVSACLTPRALSTSAWAAVVGGPQGYELVVPAGRVLIFTRRNLYEPATRVVEVGPGTNDVLLLLEKKP